VPHKLRHAFGYPFRLAGLTVQIEDKLDEKKGCYPCR
jgi:hypothetical protein